MITSVQMKELEASSGVPLSSLMKRAGTAVYEALKQKFDLKGKKILIVCYHGNNGGDGFVAARYLCDDASVDVLFLGDEKRLKHEAALNYKKIVDNIRIQFVDEDEVDFDDYDIIVDAMLGTGIQGPLKESLRQAIQGINQSTAFKVSVDIPSGMDPDTGNVEYAAVEADLILCFHDLKAGLKGMEGKTEILDIGIHKESQQQD